MATTRVLQVYGAKDGKEKLLFAMLADLEWCRKTARETAKSLGYVITRVFRCGDALNGYREEDLGDKL